MDHGPHEINEDSSTPIASETRETECPSLKEINENSSDPVMTETVIEVRSCEFECLDVQVSDSKADANVLENSSVKETSGELNGGNRDSDKICRICHLSSDCRGGPDTLGLIQIGCGCRGELGTAHRNCAETWFKLKGNRCCEICGETAKNIIGDGDIIVIEELNESRLLDTTSSRCSRGRCWRGQTFFNVLMACLVIAFIVPWLFRVNIL